MDEKNESLEAIIARDQVETRKRIALMRLTDRVRQTVMLHAMSPDAKLADVRVEMTTATGELLAPYVEAVAALEAIIWASDECAGHRNCGHSMEPWQRARAVLKRFWDEYEREVLGER